MTGDMNCHSDTLTGSGAAISLG